MTSLPSTRLGALAVLGVVVAGTLTGCGSDRLDTTCGEVRSDSSQERIALLQDLYEEQGSDDALTEEQRTALSGFGDLDAADQQAAADRLLALCEPEDDDRTIQDADGVAD